MKVLLGVTGSVAAVLTPKLVRALKIAGHAVRVVSTERGLYFFYRGDVDAPVLSDKDEWPEDGYRKENPIPHIDLGQWADILLIAPLTADTLSDMANGKCDKFLTSIVRAWPRKKPIFIAPAMNTRMWEHPLTREHILRLKEWYNLGVLNPVSKRLACGEVGMGAMADISAIVDNIS
jgi:phosphopantothenoylcysteine decarboxylase